MKCFCFVAEHTWVELVRRGHEIDESVLCIISDVFAAVEICATAN